MPLAMVVCFPSMIVTVLTENQFFHGINTKSIHNIKRPPLIGLEFLGQNKLHKLGITSEHLQKLSSWAAFNILHFMVIGRRTFNE